MFDGKYVMGRRAQLVYAQAAGVLNYLGVDYDFRLKTRDAASQVGSSGDLSGP